MEKDARIFVAGYNDIITKGLLRQLKKGGFINLLFPAFSEVEFCDQKSVAQFFREKKPDYVFLTGGKAGGIEANVNYPAEFMYNNLQIQNNVIHFAREAGVKKLLFVASSCVYPRGCAQPMKEEYLLTGSLEPTNEAYAIAKIAGIEMCRSYSKQYAVNFICAIPANVFGPGDDFKPETSHVVPALIHKFHTAKSKGDSVITIWGTGAPRREFMYVDEMAEACLFLMENYDNTKVINIGTGADVSIRELSKIVKEVVDFKGEIEFDISKPDGMPKKLLDASCLSSLGWKAETKLQSGLERTYRWYLEKFLQRK